MAEGREEGGGEEGGREGEAQAVGQAARELGERGEEQLLISREAGRQRVALLVQQGGQGGSVQQRFHLPGQPESRAASGSHGEHIE